MDNRIIYLNLSNADGLDIVNIILVYIYLYIIIVLTVYSFTILVNNFAFYLDKRGV